MISNTKSERCELALGFTISRVVTGLWQIADLERHGPKLDQDATAAEMAPYLEAGLTTFDMADHYGSAEEIAGRFRGKQENPEEVQLLTKWVPPPGQATREDVKKAVVRSLKRLQMERLDLLQLHAWNYADPSWLDCLSYLQELKEEGLIRHLGLTNFDAPHLRMALESGIEIVSNQVCFSLIDQRPLNGLTELCQERKVKLLAFGTVAGGFLTERWLGKPEPRLADLETWSQMKYWRFIEQAGGWQRFQDLLNVVHGIAQNHGVSMANVACRSVLDQPAVAGVIIGARLGVREHIADNLRLLQFSLDEKSAEEIRAATANLKPIPGNSGDEYRKPPFLTASGDLSHHVESIPPPYSARPGKDGRTRVLSGTIWEEMAGFCRAVRHKDRVVVSGTTATHKDQVIGGNDPVAQTHFVIDKIEGALQSLGGSLEDVVRTRIFIRNLKDWEAVARVHGERFREIQPANTLVQAELVGDDYLVEMEAEAIVTTTGNTQA